jgi:hypothetical protein
VLLSVYFIFLFRMTEQPDLVIGNVADGRPQAALKQLVGAFETVLPLRVQVSAATPFLEFLRDVRNLAGQAYEHQGLYNAYLLALPDGAPETKPNVYFRYDDGGPAAAGAWQPVPVAEAMPCQPGDCEFGLEVSPAPGRLHLRFVYCKDLYDTETMALFKEYYTNMLGSVLEHPSAAIAGIATEGSLKTA